MKRKKRKAKCSSFVSAPTDYWLVVRMQGFGTALNDAAIFFSRTSITIIIFKRRYKENETYKHIQTAH